MPIDGDDLWNEDALTSQFEEDMALDAIEAGKKAPDRDNNNGGTTNDDDERQEQLKAEQIEYLEKEVRDAVPPRYDDGSTQVPTIYVVPSDLAAGNEQAYIPTAVCIGPFFNSQRRSSSMLKLEAYKRCCVRKLIVGKGRTAAWVPELHRPVLGKCFDKMMRLLAPIRASYSISTSMEYIGGDSQATINSLLEKEDDDPDRNNELATRMLLDGCFVLHRILKQARLAKDKQQSGADQAGEDDDDWTQLFGRRNIWAIASLDLLLLNNQIPFFVLQELFQILKSNAAADEHEDVLINGCLELFRGLHPPTASSTPPPDISRRKVHHLLHLFYLSITHLPKREGSGRSAHAVAKNTNHGRPMWVPSATELDAAGVEIRARKDRSVTSFLDITFHTKCCGRGVLEIPRLELFDISEPLFRNLVALEQTDITTPGHVTAYAILMDCLVKTPEDMRLLHKKGVLVNHINGKSNDVATEFFSRLCSNAYTKVEKSYLAGVMADVFAYQNKCWPKQRAALQRDYFPNLWVTISVIAAGLVIVMTLLQTIYTIYGYYKA